MAIRRQKTTKMAETHAALDGGGTSKNENE